MTAVDKSAGASVTHLGNSFNPDLVKGYMLALLGIIVLSPDALIIRLADMPELLISAWRSIFGGLLILLMTCWQSGARSIYESVCKTGWIGPAVIVATSAGPLCFVVAVSNTAVSNVLVLLSCTSIFSAIISRIFLKEILPWYTLLAIVICVAGMSVIVGQDFFNQKLIGTVAAVLAALSLAITQVMLRFVKHQSMTGAIGFGYLLLPILILFYAWLTEGSISSITTIDWRGLGYSLLNGFVMGASFFFLGLAPRYISAPEVGVIMLLEVLFGSFLVWLVIGEAPTTATMIAGGIILLTLLVHGYWRIRSNRRHQQVAPVSAH